MPSISIVIGGGPRRLCRGHPRGAAGPEDRGGRARAAGRHLPQLGLHPDQGAAAHRPRSGTCMHRLDEFGFSADDIKFDPTKIVERSRKVAKQLSERRRLPDEEAQDHRDRRARRKLAGKGKLAVTKDGKTVASSPPRTSSSPPARGRARCRAWSPTASWSGPTRGDGAAGVAEVAAGRRLGRHRHRVRQLLSRPWAPR